MLVNSKKLPFTIIELLVTVSVLLLLITLLNPVFQKMQHAAQTKACMGQLGKVGVGMLLYVEDHANILPDADIRMGGKKAAFSGWITRLWAHEYVVTTLNENANRRGIFFCPIDTISAIRDENEIKKPNQSSYKAFGKVGWYENVEYMNTWYGHSELFGKHMNEVETYTKNGITTSFKPLIIETLKSYNHNQLASLNDFVHIDFSNKEGQSVEETTLHNLGNDHTRSVFYNDGHVSHGFIYSENKNELTIYPGK